MKRLERIDNYLRTALQTVERLGSGDVIKEVE